MFWKRTMANESKWFVNIIQSETWDGKNSGPTVYFESEKYTSLDDARNAIRKKIANITSDQINRLRWIEWSTNEVQIRFSYPNTASTKIYQTCVMNIQQIDQNNCVKWVDIGE